MFIIGQNTNKSNSKLISGICPKCNQKSSLEIEIVQKQLHFFHIPYWAFTKMSNLHCNSCHANLEFHDLTSDQQLYAAELIRNIKTPFYSFVGIPVFLLILTISIYLQSRETNVNKAFLMTPKIGDVFEVNAKPNEYTVGKVIKISNDSIFLQWHNYNVNTEAGLKDLIDIKGDEFSNITSVVLKQDALKMLTDKKILKVIRK